jgi:hypothetical protein
MLSSATPTKAVMTHSWWLQSPGISFKHQASNKQRVDQMNAANFFELIEAGTSWHQFPFQMLE